MQQWQTKPIYIKKGEINIIVCGTAQCAILCTEKKKKKTNVPGDWEIA